MADNARPRARGKIGAFKGGPFGIGWAPWVIGVGVLGLALIVFLRQQSKATQAQGQAGAAQGALPLGQPYPYPTGAAPAGPASNPSAQQIADSPITPDDWTPAGSGFRYEPGGDIGRVFNKRGRGYFYLQDPGAVQAYTAGGGQIYFFPVPGQPVATTYGQGSPGTPAYGAGTAQASNVSSQQIANFAA